MNGNDTDCRATASYLLEELKDVNFYISLVFMKIVTLNVQEIEIDAIQAVDTMTLTYKEFKVYEMTMKKS